MIDLLYFTSNEIIEFHDTLINRYGGIAGLRDRGLLESALAQARQEVFGQQVYTDVYEKAAAYCYFIIKNHPFLDGNKRTGMHSAITFLRLHDIELAPRFDELYQFAIDIASSEIQMPEIVDYFKKHTVHE